MDISFKNRTVLVKTGQKETLVKPTTKTWKFKAMQKLIINWALDVTKLFELHTS
jgi:adenylate cyclase